MTPEEFALQFIGNGDSPTADTMRRLIVEAITKWEGSNEAKYKEAMRALASLTPGGSEYVDDPARCVEFVRAVRTSEHKAIIYWARRAKKAEGD